MDAFNHTLFLWVNAQQPGPGLLLLGRILANGLVWLFPLYVVISWLRGSAAGREALLQGVLAACLAMLLSWLIGQAWFHPRPFMIGLGEQHLPHKPTASFPSNHLSFIWALCAGMALHPARRRAAAWLAALGLCVAWARIWMGLHFPFDMAGAALLGLLCAGLTWPLHQRFIPGLRRMMEPVYHLVFAWPIRAGWARK
ncbi:undecaprenyl-diphosphatase [Castellaniella sp.]|uniref:undecaprenyl-diphosphatase n=1 Tax=Castellaniella sp. TaxID=1955812 RepID=UPI003560A520